MQTLSARHLILNLISISVIASEPDCCMKAIPAQLHLGNLYCHSNMLRIILAYSACWHILHVSASPTLPVTTLLRSFAHAVSAKVLQSRMQSKSARSLLELMQDKVDYINILSCAISSRWSCQHKIDFLPMPLQPMHLLPVLMLLSCSSCKA